MRAYLRIVVERREESPWTGTRTPPTLRAATTPCIVARLPQPGGSSGWTGPPCGRHCRRCLRGPRTRTATTWPYCPRASVLSPRLAEP